MPKTKSQLESIRKAQKKYNKRYGINLHLSYDADIIKVLDNHKNKQGYIKELIREDIKNDLIIAKRIETPERR